MDYKMLKLRYYKICTYLFIVLTGKINDRTIKTNYSGNDDTTITTFTTRPTGPSSTKRVVSITGKQTIKEKWINNSTNENE